MVENILIFVRNCVMAVLTAWAGIQIAENVQSKKTEVMPVAAATTATQMKASDDSCPHRGPNSGSGEGQPSSAAAAGVERTAPGAQPNVMTIR
jgi:hypothetical protein